MYEQYFGLTERPFSIAPDPQYLYMSLRHKEAMAHLSYGLSQGGCFIVLTGEVGTGKTTLCRNLLGDLPSNVDVALILNANINESELLQTVCDELKIEYPSACSQKLLLDKINAHLLNTFADNRHTVLIIDEAQLLSRDVLEQIRLLTNLETTKSKLLQIILIGQPELNDLLGRNDLRQLSQRITARYHLDALQRNEIEEYVNYRLSVAGCKKPLFSRQALTKLHQLSSGIPRKINVLADHALLAAYAKTLAVVDAQTVKQAAKDVFIEAGDKNLVNKISGSKWLPVASVLLLLNLMFWAYNFYTQNSASVAPINGSTPATGEPRDQVPDAAADQAPETQPDGVLAASNELENPESGSSIPQNEVNGELPPSASNSQSARKPGSVVIADAPLDASLGAPSATADQTNTDQSQALGQLLGTSADLTGRIATFRRLAEQWGVTLPKQLLQPACSALAEQGLRCQGIDSWPQVRRFNRPTIMVLEHQGQLHRVILQSLDGQSARLQVGQQSIQVSVAELRQRWTNNALMFWQPSAAGSSFRQLDDRSSDLPDLREQLNQALLNSRLPPLSNLDSTLFDLDMSQKVFALQTRYRITADSQVGDETYLLMNEITKPESTPVLVSRVEK